MRGRSIGMRKQVKVPYASKPIEEAKNSSTRHFFVENIDLSFLS